MNSREEVFNAFDRWWSEKPKGTRGKGLAQNAFGNGWYHGHVEGLKQRCDHGPYIFAPIEPSEDMIEAANEVLKSKTNWYEDDLVIEIYKTMVKKAWEAKA
jgi:hypothetical protein